MRNYSTLLQPGFTPHPSDFLLGILFRGFVAEYPTSEIRTQIFKMTAELDVFLFVFFLLFTAIDLTTTKQVTHRILSHF